jgi:hypothetical protein
MIDRIFAAFRLAFRRRELPTSLGSEDIRRLARDVRANSVFSARATNAIYISRLKEVSDALAAGTMDEASARLALLETLRAVGYTPEGGFPDDPPGRVPPAVKGTLQDLSSFRRLRLVVETQADLTRGAARKLRGEDPDLLPTVPAWELVREIDVDVPRDWPTRWAIAGGEMTIDPLLGRARMIALKGAPIWEKLGDSEIFSDALDVAHPPFCFNSGMGWAGVFSTDCDRLGITGPGGEPWREWMATAGPAREAPGLPTPRMSPRGIDRELLGQLRDELSAGSASSAAGLPTISMDLEMDELLRQSSARAAEEYLARNPEYDPEQYLRP